MIGRIQKLTATALVFSFLGSNTCLGASYAQNYSRDLQSQLEAILTGQKAPTIKAEKQKKRGKLPSGHKLAIELTDGIDSETTQENEIIRAKLVLPIEINNQIVIPEGSEITGKILSLKKSGSWYQNALIEAEFQQIECNTGYNLPIIAQIETKDKSGALLGASGFDRFGKIASTLAFTTLGGVLTGFGVGLLTPYALIGAVIGTGVGFLTGCTYLFFQKGESVELPAGTKLIITLQNDVSINGI